MVCINGRENERKKFEIPNSPKNRGVKFIILYVSFNLFALDFLVCKIKELESQNFWYMCLDR